MCKLSWNKLCRKKVKLRLTRGGGREKDLGWRGRGVRVGERERK